MRKILPVLIVVAAVYLTPLYPIYAQTPTVTARPLKVASVSGGLKAQLIENRVDRKEMISDQIMARKDKIASRAAELKAKLQKFKDKNKAKRVENINENLNTVNTKITGEMQQNLTRMSDIVAKLKTWVTEQEAAGKDVSAIKSAITNIESQWTAANTALTDQADNDYTVAVNTESTVKADAQTSRNSLRTDLKSIHDKIASVRQSLISAFTSWKGTSNGQ